MSYRNQTRARDAGPAYLRGHKRAIRECLARPHVATRIACLQEQPDTILGYSVIEGRCCHYIFVKRDFRGEGLARSLIRDLLDGQPATYSHRGWKAAPAAWSYSPYSLFFGEDARDA